MKKNSDKKDSSEWLSKAFMQPKKIVYSGVEDEDDERYLWATIFVPKAKKLTYEPKICITLNHQGSKVIFIGSEDELREIGKQLNEFIDKYIHKAEIERDEQCRIYADMLLSKGGDMKKKIAEKDEQDMKDNVIPINRK